MMSLAPPRAPVGKASARAEAFSASRSQLAGNVLRASHICVGKTSSCGSRQRPRLAFSVRADGESIVNVVDEKQKDGSANGSNASSTGAPGDAAAASASADSLGTLLNGNGQKSRSQAQGQSSTPPTPFGASVVPYKQAVTGALAKAMQGTVSSAELTVAKHKLLTGSNEAVRGAYERYVKPEDVMLGADGDAEDRSGADASTSGAPSDGAPPKAKELATQLAVLLSEKAKIEVTGQLNRVRDKMTSRVSKANSYARTLEQGIRQRDKALAETHSKLETLQEEMDKMRQMLEDGARESPYIVDRKLITERFEILAARAKSLRKQVDLTADTVDQQRVRRVRVEWTGYADEVRLMGSFDNWTRGIPLAREGTDDNQGGLILYSVEVPLRPGVYEMKLFCDGQWFEIRHFPVDDSPRRNNIVRVE